MKNLNKRQSLGCFFNNLGNVYSEIGDVNTAMLALERAVTINSDPLGIPGQPGKHLPAEEPGERRDPTVSDRPWT